MAKRGILEIGRFNGGSLFLMACANPAVSIYSIEIAPQDDLCLCEIFRRPLSARAPSRQTGPAPGVSG
jgi:hypothetical protein